jgi:DNA-binding NarL/FixJ family response regulator
MIDVAIVEDNATVRQGLAALIGGTPGFRCAGAWADCESLLPRLKGMHLDVLLMDIVLPGMSGIEGVRRVKEIRPDLDVLMLSVYDDNDRVFEALCAGASGYLVKKTPPARLLEAIQEARAGGSPMSSHIARKVVDLLRRTSPPRPAKAEAVLTPREREILHGLAEGNSYQELAGRLHISADTVRFHIRNIYRKLQAHSQSEAVAKALRKGIL